jgi:hypothetical protein
MSRTKFAILFAFSIGLTLTAVAFAHTSDAAPSQFSFVIHDDIDMIPVGTTFTKTVDSSAVAGRTCTITSHNNDSVHTGASMMFASGGHTLFLAGVEDAAGVSRNGELLMGATLTGTVTTGQDPDYEEGMGGFSAGAVVVDCPDVPTTTTVPSTTTTAPPNVPPSVVVVPPTRFTG